MTAKPPLPLSPKTNSSSLISITTYCSLSPHFFPLWPFISHQYILHFDVLDDLLYISGQGPWAADGSLLVLERWRPNLVIIGLQLNYVSLCVQLHGLSLEYQYPELAMQMGQILGIYERIDWDFTIPRNICFMRVRVRMDPWMPLIAGFMLRVNNGDRVWIQCRYERVHKVCTKCGLIRHTRA